MSIVEAVQKAMACVILNDSHYEEICYNHRAPLVDGQCALANSVANAATAALEAE